MDSAFARAPPTTRTALAERNGEWDSSFPGLGGHAVVAALVVATNLAPTAGLDGLADYTGAAACALGHRLRHAGLGVPGRPAPVTRPGRRRHRDRRAPPPPETTGPNRDTATASRQAWSPPGARRPARAPRRRPTARAPTTTRPASSGGHRRGRPGHHHHDGRRRAGRGRRGRTAGDAAPTPTTPATAPDEAGDNPASRHAPVVHERDDDEQASAGDDADTPSPPRRAAAAPARVPGDLIDLADWYLTLPTGSRRRPRHRSSTPTWRRYSSALLRAQRHPRRRRVHRPRRRRHHQEQPLPAQRAAGDERPATRPPGPTPAACTPSTCAQAVTHLPDAKPEAVAAQIHDANDDVLQIRLEGTRLLVQYDDGKKQVELDPNYTLGTRYTLTITAADRRVRGHLQRREESRPAAQRIRLVLQGRRLRPGQRRHRRRPEQRRGDRVRAAGPPLRRRQPHQQCPDAGTSSGPGPTSSAANDHM